LNVIALSKKEIFDALFKTELTKQEALVFYKSKFWESEEWQPCELAYLQFNQNRLFLPFDTWWEMVDKTVGHPTLNIFYGVPSIQEEVEKVYHAKITNSTVKEITDYDPVKKRVN